MSKQLSIGVVGEHEVVGAFRAIGMRVTPASEAEDIAAAVFHMAQDGVPVIFITESAAQKVPETLERYKNDARVAIIPIPGSNGSDGFGMRRVTANVEKAIGANILFNNEEE